MNKKLILMIILSLSFFVLMYYSYIKGYSYTLDSFKDLLFFKIEDKNNKEDLISKSLNDELKDDIKELKKLTKIDYSLDEFYIVNATVINRMSSVWLEELTINKGSKDKIKVGDAVVVSEGLIGRIEKTTKHTSVVKLITSSDNTNKISVKFISNDQYFYKVLEKENNEFVIKGVDKNAIIDKDVVIVTSGLSDLYPQGIRIGEIDRVVLDKYEVSNNLYIKSVVDFDNIKYVSVLGRDS